METNAWVRLPGHEAVAAHADVDHRNRRTRIVRSIVALGATLVITPIVFILPPHIPWMVIALVWGGYTAHQQWRGEFVVRSFEGVCPRCHSPLVIEPGTKIRLPHQVDCFNCHHEPTLVIAEGEE